jgi:hypothetical protein
MACDAFNQLPPASGPRKTGANVIPIRWPLKMPSDSIPIGNLDCSILLGAYDFDRANKLLTSVQALQPIGSSAATVLGTAGPYLIEILPSGNGLIADNSTATTQDQFNKFVKTSVDILAETLAAINKERSDPSSTVTLPPYPPHLRTTLSKSRG